MKASKSGSDYAIYHFNRFIAITGSVLSILLGWQFMLPIIGAGWLVYFILYYLRDIFYRQGFARYYIFSTLFYFGVLLSFMIKPSPPVQPNLLFNLLFPRSLYDLSNLPYKLVYILVHMLNWSVCGWGISVGVVLYVFMVELDRKKVKIQDIESLRVSKDDLYNYPVDLIFTSQMVSIFILALVWSWVLAVGLMVYIKVASYFKQFQKWLDLSVLAIVILLSAEAQFTGLLDWSAMVVGWGVKNTVFDLLKREFTDFLEWIHYGVLLGAVPLLLSRIATNFNRTTEAVAINEEVRKNKFGYMAAGDMLLGYHALNKHRIALTDKENNQHTLIMGTTGAGKTTAILNYVAHCAKNAYPCIFLDGKGSPDLPLKLKQIADKHNRTFKFFTLKPHIISGELERNLASYNPFGSGTFTEWKNRIMSLFSQAEGRGQQHYALMEEKFINNIVNILQKTGRSLNLKQLLAFLREPELLMHLATKIADPVLIQQAEQLKEQKEIATDVVALLELFIYSSYGALFDPVKMPNVIDLKKAIANGEIILFLFDASAYKSDTEKVAKMVINDLNSSFSELSSPVPTYAIFDEFASYASSNLSDTISLQRSNGMHAVIGTQSVTTVGLKSLETQRIAEELIACCNTYLLMATNHDEDIERMAKIFGTRRTFEVTTQLDVKQGGGTGLGSAKTVDEFLVHPQKIRNLRTGEAFIYRKALGLNPFKITINHVAEG